MPRARSKTNRGLPTRWRYTFGAYYYQVPPGLEHLWDGKQSFRLSDKLHEAYKIWSDRISKPTEAKTIGDLLDRYALEVIPKKAPASQASNFNQLKMLKRVFGKQPLEPFTPQLVYQYVGKRSVKKVNPETGKVTGGTIAAHREIELLSHAYTKAVQWGYISRHPFKHELRLEGEKPRDRYVEDWEIVEMLSLDSKRKSGSVLMIQAYLRLKLLTGLPQGDLLRLTEENLQHDGIHNQRHKTAAKTGKKTIYEWTPSLRAAVDLARSSRTRKTSAFLFCNRDGQGYVNEVTGQAAGWKSMWQRFVERVIKETKVTEHFTEHDLRAKVGSDASSLAHAQALLAHADSRTTKRIYRRKAEIVKPLK